MKFRNGKKRCGECWKYYDSDVFECPVCNRRLRMRSTYNQKYRKMNLTVMAIVPRG